ncbi:LPS assembly outer membrane protein LptD (organic solvent tolerance protein OstA) [Candidatus Kryptonium thompsonii]|uniref:LPS assembly outer membrane protein LptD (Organic solvent tolerance protein OstA) n=2 Tax=Candidatus Kryptonium thompsonii TaxID=1633631 RepID=A0A0P1LPA4_9BACT|nr:putative LPS assembly protein LptD [Candidatus Kryptonium thompsoni]CUS79510.1 LPS assembly outer membrane protein LptD (organic solvent tolerance protein OstA) [Candidatus Kryptonium thompsoni]CUS83688.1 LPS assembly outer membrane protein LptD (organic solvent tolerance protein OstA) [Candidatus Kryptonium thompsoni]CUS84824.1 LPS assembly outer membrane protein LptD (organic solvent tolerance protein OstA) [Candidatus Kryptonium thompsoni]CUS84913.1 LPS assembly outer membrane protein Lpt
MNRLRIEIIVLLIFFATINAQEHADTTKVRKSEIDTTVVYTAVDSAIYDVENRNMFLFGNADIKYKTMRLRSAFVRMNLDSTLLEASGIPDSTGNKITGAPILNDGGEEYHGFKLAYNFKTQKGRITQATTQMENAFYYGDRVKKVDKDVLFVYKGRYTTCDAEEPHFYIEGRKMKIIVNDKVIARPVVLYIADVPVFALPFGVFPNKSGRRSGFIPPVWGQTYNTGFYFKRFGYYWAMSDYADFATTFDWYTRGGWQVSSDFRYALRYKFNGAIGFAFANFYSGEEGDPDKTSSKEWRLNIIHSQNIDPTSRISANVNISTNNYFRATGTTVRDVLQQTLISNVSYSKTIESINGSISINASRVQNLNTGTVDEVLPEISFSLPQVFPFAGGVYGVTDGKWHQRLSFGYSSRFVNKRSTAMTKQFSYGMAHNLSVNFAPTIRYFNVTPFFTYYENWYDRRTIKFYNPETKQVETKIQKGFFQARYFKFGVSVSTKLYGIWQPEIFGISGFRHTLMPSVSLVYQPDFSSPFWKNYGSYVDSTGQIVKYSYFENSIFGGAPIGKLQSLNVGIGNIFEMKTTSSDSAGQPKKYQLLNLNLSFSYNFVDPNKKLSPLFVTARTTIAGIDIFSSSTFDFYKFNSTELLIREGKIARLTNFSLAFSFTFSGRKKQETERMQGIEGTGAEFFKNYEPFKPSFEFGWNFSFGFDFSLSRITPYQTIKSANLRFTFGFDVTKNWRIMGSGSYDPIRKEIVVPSISIYRDLHCWEANFEWRPVGYARGFDLEIRVKAPQLHDLKIVKRKSNIGR